MYSSEGTYASRQPSRWLLQQAALLTAPVILHSDPFEHMAPLGEYDWQIQDEAIEGNVNTGFFHIMPTESTISHWKGVLAMDMKQASRDQHNTNTLLGTEKIRPISEQMEGPAFLSQFESQNGISMNVIPTEVIALILSIRITWHSLGLGYILLTLQPGMEPV
jgi:hypothetical protein